MSDHWIIVFPADPHFVPPDKAQSRAAQFFGQIAPCSERIVAATTSEIKFIHCGSNFEGVSCPKCRSPLDIRWWQSRMDEEFADHFPLKLVEMPCCRNRASLEELEYRWPQGFARFTVEAMNPDIPDVSMNDMEIFKLLIGCEVRKVLRHL